MDKELLFKPALPEREVEIPGKGTVRVKAITRAQLHAATKGAGKDPDPADVERRTVVAGLVDPQLTYAEVCRWFEIAAAGEVQPVMHAIMELSGMTEDAHKSGVSDVRGEPGA